MAPLCYRRHRFPPEIIQRAVWLYLRFTLSYRDVEELLAERGLDISYETVRRWVLRFGPAIARRLRQRRPRPSNRWHLDEPAATRCTRAGTATHPSNKRRGELPREQFIPVRSIRWRAYRAQHHRLMLVKRR